MKENPYREIRQVLESRGWTNGSWESKDGKLCILGAVNVYFTGKAHYYPDPMGISFSQRRVSGPRRAVLREIAAEAKAIDAGFFTDLDACIYHWNDRTASGEHVFAVLRTLERRWDNAHGLGIFESRKARRHLRKLGGHLQDVEMRARQHAAAVERGRLAADLAGPVITREAEHVNA